MKIIQAVGWYYPESLGGVEVYVAGLCRRLRANGHEVLVAAPDPEHSEERMYDHDGVPVYRYPIPNAPTRDETRGMVSARGTESFHTWLTKQKPDVFHLHSFGVGLGLVEIKAAKATGARVIVTEHTSNLGYICQRGTMMRWGERLCDGVCRPIKCAGCVLQHRGLPKPLSQVVGAIPPAGAKIGLKFPGKVGTALGMSELIARHQAMQHEMLANADNFVLLTQWALKATAANGAPLEKLVINRLGLSHREISKKPDPKQRPTRLPINVGYLGRFYPEKGVYDLARAVASLSRDVPIRVEFRGPILTDAEREVVSRLRELVKEDPRVRFAPAIPEAEVPNVLTKYDVLCCPSVCLEGGPTVAIEAHAVGTPVVGTLIGGLAEMVSDGINGRLVEPGDWRALARLLREIASDPKGTVDFWRLSLPAVRTMDEVAAQYLSLYTS